MTTFHRFVDPTYTNAPVLPTGPATVPFDGVNYNRLNVISGGTGGSGSAYADADKTSGPNVGTYFVAFGEDATSTNVNRGFRALAENTDYLDDVLHKDIALPTSTAVVTPGAPVPSIPLGDGTYVGHSPTYPLDMLFELVDENDAELFNPTTGAQIKVASITGATIGDGFCGAGGITLVLSESIPTGQKYRVYYSTRTNLAALPPDAFSYIKIRGAMEVDSDVEANFHRILAPSTVSHAWNSSPTSSLYELAQAGLDERYRRATTTRTVGWVPYPFTGSVNQSLDYPGAGGAIDRDGLAPSSFDMGGIKMDPISALWRAVNATKTGGQSTAPVGFLYEGAWNTPDMTGTTNKPSLASFMAVTPFDCSTYASTPYTQIPSGATGTFHAAVGLTPAYVVLDAPNYATDGAKTSIVVDYDMLEMLWSDGVTVSVMRIKEISHAEPTKIKLDRVAGAAYVPSDGDTVTVRWLRLNFAVSEGDTASDSVGLAHIVPPQLSATEATPYSGSFGSYAGPFMRAIAGGNASSTTLWPNFVWGYQSLTGQTSTFTQTGALLSDGSVYGKKVVLQDVAGGLTQQLTLTAPFYDGILGIYASNLTLTGQLRLNASSGFYMTPGGDFDLWLGANDFKVHNQASVVVGEAGNASSWQLFGGSLYFQDNATKKRLEIDATSSVLTSPSGANKIDIDSTQLTLETAGHQVFYLNNSTHDLYVKNNQAANSNVRFRVHANATAFAEIGQDVVVTATASGKKVYLRAPAGVTTQNADSTWGDLACGDVTVTGELDAVTVKSTRTISDIASPTVSVGLATLLATEGDYAVVDLAGGDKQINVSYLENGQTVTVLVVNTNATPRDVLAVTTTDEVDSPRNTYGKNASLPTGLYESGGVGKAALIKFTGWLVGVTHCFTTEVSVLNF